MVLVSDRAAPVPTSIRVGMMLRRKDSPAEPLVSQAACQLSGEYVDGSGNDEPEDDQ
jgi:hypothetical protein